MKMKRLVSLMLALLLISTMAVVSVTAADTSKVTAGAYYNQGEDSGRGYANSVYSGSDLGANYSPSSTTWKVWSPAASKVQLKLYKTGTDRENGAGVIGTYDLTKGSSSVWSKTLTGDYKNVYYTYLITAKNVAGTVVTNETQDVYSKAVGANGNRSMVVDLDSTDPEGWNNDKHVTFGTKTEAAVWELHIRDFSADPDSGVSDENRGAYLAFTEGGTTYKKQGTVKTCMDYLVENNINTVQIMPMADFDGTDEIYGNSVVDRNWGYNPKNFNVPDGSYSSNAYDGNVRINETKQMVQALHDRGISVVMDVVYNHTAGADGSCFTKTVPGYYYRMSSALAYANGSGQGNELATEKGMVRNFIVQSMEYWANEYHIDGFRFDLMGCIDITTLNQARTKMNAINKNILMYGEPWTGGDSGIPAGTGPTEDNTNKLSDGVGVFSGKFRSAATRVATTGSASQGWIGGVTDWSGGTATVVAGIKGAVHDASYKSKTVNFIDCHDDLTVWDKITGAYTKSGEGKASSTTAPNVNSTAANYTGTLKLAGALALTSQGISFFNAGTEFARTKQGQANSYNSPDYVEQGGQRVAINMLDWKRVSTYKEVVDYYKGLRQINEVYSAFNDDGTTAANSMSFMSQTGTFIAYTINNNKSGQWGKVAVLLNSGNGAATANLSGSWVVVANDKKAGITNLGTASGSYSVPAHSAAILVEASSFNNLSQNKFSYGTLTTNHHVNGKTTTVKSYYRVGTKYTAVKDASLLKNYNVRVEGTPSGTFNGDTTVDYYYEANGKSYGDLTVQYLDQNNKKLTPDMVYTLEKGEKYSIPVCTIQSYQLNTASYPANTTGTFDGNAKTITFKYKPLASQTTKVHYHKTNNWTSVTCYAYTDDGQEPNGVWSKNPTMQADPEKGSGWYVCTLNVPACRVMFHPRSGSGQEPGQNEPGYSVGGECFIDKGVVTYESTITTSYIDIDSGKQLKADSSATAVKKNTDQYTTTGDDTLGKLVETPANAAGFYQPGTTNVVYLYKTKEDQPTTAPPTTVPATEPPTSTTPVTVPQEGTTAPVTMGDSNLLGDANCDKNISIKDVTYIQQYIVNLTFFDARSLRNSDVDGNNIVNIKDASLIQRWLAKIPVSYPIGEEIKDAPVVVPTAAPTDAPTAAPTEAPQPQTDPATDAPTEPEPEPEPTDPVPPEPEYRTVMFSNNKFWSGQIYCYHWFDGEDPGNWPGDAMTEAGTNEYGEGQWSIEVPVGCNVIFTNGESQTADTVFTGSETGFFPAYPEAKDDLGHFLVDSW